MATVEVIEKPKTIPNEVVQGEIVDNQPLPATAGELSPEQFNNELARREMQQSQQQPAINPMAVDSQTLYQAAAQYDEAAQQTESVAAGFEKQAQAQANTKASLERAYAASPQQISSLKTTAATLVGAVGGMELLKLADKNIYHSLTTAEKGIDAAVGAMGRNTNTNPLNWIGNLVESSKSVVGMQEGVSEAVTKVSGKNLANAINPTIIDLTKEAGIDKATQQAFSSLDKAVDQISALRPEGNIIQKTFGVKTNIVNKAIEIVEGAAKKAPDAIKQDIQDLGVDIWCANPLANKEQLVEAAENGLKAFKNNQINNVPDTNAVTGSLLGSAKQIKEKIIDGLSGNGKTGMENAADAVEKGWEGNKVAEFVVGARDKFQNAPKNAQTAIVAGVAILGATLAYLAVNAVNENRKQKLDGLEEQIAESEQKQGAWAAQVGSAKVTAAEARTAANNIKKLGDFRSRMEAPQEQAVMGL